MPISDFWYFGGLPPKFQDVDFSDIFSYKSQNFQIIRKSGICVIKIHTNNTYATFQINAIIFSVQLPKKDKGYDFTYLNVLFGISNSRR